MRIFLERKNSTTPPIWDERNTGVAHVVMLKYWMIYGTWSAFVNVDDLKASESRTKAEERGAYFERNKEMTPRWIWKVNAALSIKSNKWMHNGANGAND